MTKQAFSSDLSTEAGFVRGQGSRLESLHTALREIASTDIPVLLLGESGTGKDMYARLLHQHSNRSGLNLRKVSCPVLDPAELLRMAHSGLQTGSEPGQTGTLFLDSIDELEPACQRTLLSLLPDDPIQIGNGDLDSFPRLISSSSRNLDELVEAGLFRKELYFRISGLCLRLPPLRERKEDIPVFLDHFLRKHALELKRPAPAYDQVVVEQLTAYDWPGNIRQFENLTRQMVVFGNPKAVSGELGTENRALGYSPFGRGNTPLKLAAKTASKKAERELILRALERTHWNRKQAARDLQVSYKSLLCKIKQIEASNGKH